MPATTSPNTLATTSDNGRNLRAELKPESYFFIEKKDNAFSQDPTGKFGITGTGETSKFRTTSKISYSGKVFTICQGQIFVQPNAGSADKVNVILKPFSQPIKGLAIKYIIYRGLNKSDFFTPDGKVVAKNDNNTGFVKEIWIDFEKFNPGVTVFPQEYIGYPAAQPQSGQEQSLNDLIDDYFFKMTKATETETQKFAFELPLIKGGTYLGNANETLGIDIVLNEGDFTIDNDPNPFKLDLKFARSLDHILDPAGTSNFKKKLIRESATWFIDIAAFYGLHIQGKGKVKIQQTSVLENRDEIYNVIKNFATINTVYLYIQSNRQRSYNFYGNYQVSATITNNIKIGTTTDNMLEKKFGTEGWPVEEIVNRSSLKCSLFTDNNTSAGMYVKMGFLDSSTENEDYFLRNKNLLKDDNTDIYTKDFGFTFSQTTDNKSISSFVQLIYEGAQLPVQEVNTEMQETTIRYMKDIDDVFGLIDAEPKMKAKSNTELHYVIDQNLLLINFENKTGGQDIATVTTKRSEDLIIKEDNETEKRFTYETLLNNIRQNMGSFFESCSAYSDNSNSGTLSFSKEQNNFYRPEKPYYLQTEIFTGGDSNAITGSSLHLEDGTLPSKKILGITEDENNSISSIALNNPKFFFKNELEDEKDYYTSSEGTQYRKYSLCVIGEDQNGGLKFFEPTDKVFVTTIDNCVYASEEYAKWVPVNQIYQEVSNYVKVPV